MLEGAVRCGVIVKNQPVERARPRFVLERHLPAHNQLPQRTIHAFHNGRCARYPFRFRLIARWVPKSNVQLLEQRLHAVTPDSTLTIIRQITWLVSPEQRFRIRHDSPRSLLFDSLAPNLARVHIDEHTQKPNSLI